MVRDRVRRCRLLRSFQEGLEGDCGKDRVRWCHLLKSFQEGPHQKLFFQEKIKILQASRLTGVFNQDSRYIYVYNIVGMSFLPFAL